MPTYEYECRHCGHRFEAFQMITDKPLNRCPKCSKSVKRLIGSGAGIIFKGAGFYATDYRKKTKSGPSDTKGAPCADKKDGCQGCSGSSGPLKKS
jgi:putative FmdB family regulatory protein